MALTKLNNNSLGAITSAGLPTGSVIQVKQATASGNLGSGNQTLVSVSITPADANNRILVIGHTQCYTQSGATSFVDMYRGSTFIYRSAINVGWDSMRSNSSASPIYWDDPQTTSAITYELRGVSSGSTPGSWNYYTNANTANTSITVMEIAV